MKIFYKKDYLDLKNKYDELLQENKKLNKKIARREYKYLEDYVKATNRCEKQLLEILKMEDQIEILKKGVENEN